MRSASPWLLSAGAGAGWASALGMTTGSGGGGGSGRVIIGLGSTRTKGGVTTSFTSTVFSMGRLLSRCQP